MNSGSMQLCIFFFFFCRQAFRISRSYFSMLLLDELGLDRERFIIPMASGELFSYVEHFVMAEEEREKLEEKRSLCDEEVTEEL